MDRHDGNRGLALNEKIIQFQGFTPVLFFNKLRKTYRAILKIPANRPDIKPIDRFNIYDYYVVRPLSFLPAILFYRLGMSANFATFIGFLIGIAGNTLFMLPHTQSYILAAILINVFHLFDYIDGNIARLRKWPNYFGKFIDAMSGGITYTLLCISTGMAAYHVTGNIIYVLLGSLTACLILWDRYMSLRFSDAFRRVQSSEASGDESARERHSSATLIKQNNSNQLLSDFFQKVATIFPKIEIRYRENLSFLRVVGLLVFSFVGLLQFYVVVMLVAYSIVVIPSMLLTLLQARRKLQVYRP